MQIETLSHLRAHRSLRWVAFFLAFLITGPFIVPVANVSAQTPAGEQQAGVIDIVPETAYFYAQLNFNPDSDQFQLAGELFQRAGFEQDVQESVGDMEEIPANAQVGIVVTSIPEASSLEADAVATDPTMATESLDEGGYAVVFTADDTESAYQSELENIQSGGGEITETEYGGVTITSSAPVADEGAETSAIAMVGNFGVTASRAEDIHPIIDTFNGDIASLATNENYQTLTGMLPAENLASGFINGPALLDAVEQQAEETLTAIDERTTRALDAYSVFSFSAEQQGFRLETRSMPNETPFDEVPTLDGNFIDTVPSNALFVINGTNIDSTGIVTTIAQFFASELVGVDPLATPIAGTPVPTNPDEVFTQAESLLGFNLKTDFVDQLVGEFGMTITAEGLTGGAVPTVDGLIMSEVDNAATVQDVLSKVSFIVGAGLGDQTTIATREVNGSQVYVIDSSQSGVAEQVEFGVVDGELVISVGNGLDNYLNGPDSALSADPNFTAVMENLPSEYTSITYVNMPAAIDLALGLSSMTTANIEDADPSCGNYATQADAQEAYDADQFENFMLDQDFDGQACEDYFANASATPTAEGATPYNNILGLATVSTQNEGINGTSTFLLIGDE